MIWVWIFFAALGVVLVGQGVLMIAWSVWELLLCLFRRDEWRDYPDMDESLRRHRSRRW